MKIAVILASGKSKRMRGIDKIFYSVKKKPLVLFPILTFEKHPQIQKIILVAEKSNFKKFLSLAKKYRLKKLAMIVEGGKERQDSSFRGLKAAEKLGAKTGDLILFHNGANPLVSQKEISQVIKAAKRYGAALVGQLSRDTVKETDKKGFLVKTIDRKKIFLAQTPQAIEYQLAKKAFKKAVLENFYGTDDVSLVERLKKKVKAVPASSRNIKITYPEDLESARCFLK